MRGMWQSQYLFRHEWQIESLGSPGFCRAYPSILYFRTPHSDVRTLPVLKGGLVGILTYFFLPRSARYKSLS